MHLHAPEAGLHCPVAGFTTNYLVLTHKCMYGHMNAAKVGMYGHTSMGIQHHCGSRPGQNPKLEVHGVDYWTNFT